MSQFRVNLIGAGKVGKTLVSLLDTIEGCTVQDVLSKSHRSAQEAARLTGSARVAENYVHLRPADLWIIAVPDAAISTVASDLANAFQYHEPLRTPPIAIHCSGFHTADELNALRALNWQLASAHPVLSFADPQVAKSQFQGALCGLEGDKGAIATIRQIFERMGAKCFTIRSDRKSLYHAAAVFSNNFTVVLQAIAREAWVEAGLSEETIYAMNRGLLNATSENVAALGPQRALTGPAARGDEHVVTSQGNDVNRWHPQAGAIYSEMSALAQTLKKHGVTQSPSRPDAEGDA